MTSMEVAQTILQQLGGRRFLTMTGARDLTGYADALAFKLPRFSGVKVNYVKLTLTPADTYTVEFSRIHGRTVTKLSEHTDVYCDQLQRLFEKVTGLRTSL
jgi:hypothetical protein